MAKPICVLLTLTALAGCTAPWSKTRATFGDDLAFLEKHTDVITLAGQKGGAMVAVVPLYQGRVMTSTADGPDGLSYGWINRPEIASGKRQPHINVFGGEDRYWLGPEGGQFSIFFTPGVPFDFEHWQTPEVLDWGGWQVIERGTDRVHFRKMATLVNYSRTGFDVLLDRTVRLVDPAEVQKGLGVELGPSIRAVAFESENRLANVGRQPWEKATGLLSIWILCMFTPSPGTTIVVPFVEGPEDKLGPIVNDAYFGKVPADRLVIKDGVVFFKGDGKHRGKIGISRARAKPILGSYDAQNRVLTLAQYSLPKDAKDYVNSMWEIQQHPYAGDVANSYNDGPPAPGVKPLGPFYELESSSPAAELRPGESVRHTHRTIHLQGPEEDLGRIAKATLGVDLEEIRNAFR